VAALAASTGCAQTDVFAPVGRAPEPNADKSIAVERPAVASHVVRAGETLYAIAWRYGLDYRTVARWNDVTAPYTIFPGQRIHLQKPADVAGSTQAKAQPKPATTASARPVKSERKPPQKNHKKKSRPVKKSARPASPFDGTGTVKSWRWPTKGKVVGSYKRSGNKGVDISGREGQSVMAAADGRIVYSGSGLIGYGELIIIKHSRRFLSAYAHNQSLLVKEGDVVTGGQRIASMGRSGTDRVKLHFEIRKDGKPVNPARYLPK